MWCLWGGALLILCLWNAPGVKNTPMSHGWLSLLAQPRRCSSILLFLSIGRESLRWSLTTPVGVASPRGTSGTAVSVKVTINKEEEEEEKKQNKTRVCRQFGPNCQSLRWVKKKRNKSEQWLLFFRLHLWRDRTLSLLCGFLFYERPRSCGS